MDQTEKWRTDMGNINPEFGTHMLFKNDVVEEFLGPQNKHFLIASKEIGKTLLLTCKRFILEQHYSEFRYDARESPSTNFIPHDKPYLDFISDLGALSDDEKTVLSNRRECKALWETAFALSLISYHDRNETLSKNIDIDALCSFDAQLANLLLSFGRREENRRQRITPADMFYDLLKCANIWKFQEQYSGRIRRTFLDVVRSGVFVFVDRTDQGLSGCAPGIWITVQVALQEAAWDIMRLNQHVKIYVTTRQEAYANYESENKLAMEDKVSYIKYSREDLQAMLTKLINVYEKKDSLGALLGFTHLQNNHTNEDEDAFDYIYRHTMCRPRDFAAIFARMPRDTHDMSEDVLRDTVNECAERVIVKNLFAESEVLLDVLDKRERRERLLSSIPSNVLTLAEVKKACREFNERSTCPDDCKDSGCCHPFCELYNIGLLGVIEQKPTRRRPEQVFLRPDELRCSSGSVLPLRSPFYLVHPGLQEYICSLRNEEGYRISQHVTVGIGQPWNEETSKVFELERVLCDIRDETLRSELLAALGAMKPESEVEKKSTLETIRSRLGQLREAGKVVLEAKRLAEELLSML